MDSNIQEYSRQFIDILIKNIDSAIFIMDKNNKIIETNEVFLKLFNFSKEEALTKSYFDIVGCQKIDNSEKCNFCYICNLNKKNIDEDTIITKKEERIGSSYFCRHFMVKSQKIDFASQSLTLVFLNDITNLIEKTKKLEELCTIDELTGVYNRRFILEKLESEIEISKRYHSPLSIIILDIDNFKDINDNLGHLAGDKVLIKTSETIRNSLRESDNFGRIGGEEFIIVLPNTDLEKAHMCGERIRTNISSQSFEQHDYVVTVSGGIASYVYNESMESFFKRADNLLYKAKKTGKNLILSK
jgi:diguanylate cyclase (GGDEF)-like protein